MPPNNVTCVESFHYINGGCYQLTNTPSTWIEAVSLCQQQGGNLITIHSLAQNRWVYEYFRMEGRTSGSLWIGLNDISKEGSYQWVDGSGGIASYSNWISGEPNNAGSAQNCMVLWSGYLGLWGDIECWNTFPALCKWNNTITSSVQGSYNYCCKLQNYYIISLHKYNLFVGYLFFSFAV